MEVDAAAIIANAILPQYGGMVGQIYNVQSIALIPAICGTQKDSVLAGANQNNAVILFNYHLLWHFSHTCGNNGLNASFTGDNSYEGLNYISKDQTSGNWVYLNQSTTCILTGSAVRSGNERLKGIGSNSFASTIEFNHVNITIDPLSKQIITGQLEVKMYDTSSNDFYYNGNITFSGSNRATLILNSGRTYPFSW